MKKRMKSRLVFLLRSARSTSYQLKRSSEGAEQLIFLIVLGAHFVCEDEAEIDDISE